MTTKQADLLRWLGQLGYIVHNVADAPNSCLHIVINSKLRPKGVLALTAQANGDYQRFMP